MTATTTDLADFGARERGLLVDLLMAWEKQGLPQDFYCEDLTITFNKSSGFVFLVNSEDQVLCMNGDKLEIWNNCFQCGHEGFEEYCQLNEEGCNECKDK